MTAMTPLEAPVLELLQAPGLPEDDHWDVRHNVTAKGFQPGGGAPGFRSVSAPVTRPGQENRGPPQLAQCWLCSQNIMGVFLQVKGNPQGGLGG